MAESTKPPRKAPARKAAAAKKTTAATKATRRVKEQTEEKETMPSGGTAQLLAAWAIAAAGVAVAAKVSGRELPERVGIPDVLLIGIATHELTRIVTKEWVTAPLRAPITKYEESRGSGEVEERSRGRGLPRAMGDPVTCPFCGSALIAGALVTGLVFAPRATRLVAALFASVAVSDWLHQGYDLARSTRDSV
jgi:hypothetical protein